MATSFTFDGKNCKTDFGIRYAPDLRDTYVWKPVAHTIHEQRFDAHPGGYYYGSTPQWKDIVIRCFFEDKLITDGFLTRIERFYHIGRTGKLTFSNRPWCYYNATIVQYDDTQLRNKHNGVLQMVMRCYYPYARGLKNMNQYTASDITKRMLQNSGLSAYNSTLFPTSFTFDSVTSKPIPFPSQLLNPGTVRADTLMKIRCNGSLGDGIIIKNRATNQECKIQPTLTPGVDYYLDSLNGYCYVIEYNERIMKPLHHDFDFIQLLPAELMFIDDVYWDAESEVLVGDWPYDIKDLKGKIIRLNAECIDTIESADYATVRQRTGNNVYGEAAYGVDVYGEDIVAVTLSNYSITSETNIDYPYAAVVDPVNKLTIEAVGNTATNITVSFDYKPTFM